MIYVVEIEKKFITRKLHDLGYICDEIFISKISLVSIYNNQCEKNYEFQW